MKAHSYFSNKARSLQNEKKAAKTFGGRLQPASGALPSIHKKGDIKSDLFLVDAKVTKHESYSLTLPLWNKLNSEAWQNNRRPAFYIEFGDGTRLVVLDELTFKQLKAAYERTKNTGQD